MSKIFGYAIVVIGLVIGLLIAATAFNESAASKIYAQGQAESMIIRASSQAQQAAMSTLFPYFVLGLGFLGIILVFAVWFIIGDRRNQILAESLAAQTLAISQKPVIERHYIESQKVVLLGQPTDRKTFYQTLEKVPIERRITNE